MKTQFDTVTDCQAPGDWIKKYKEQRDYIRNMFETEKTGEQSIYTDQSKLFKPIIESQKEIQDKLSQNMSLVPLIRELQRDITNQGFLTEPDLRSGAPQEEPIHHLPFLDQTSTPKEKGDTSFGADLRPVLLVDVDKGLLNDTNCENLEDMGLDLPSVVQKRGTFKETLEKVESE